MPILFRLLENTYFKQIPYVVSDNFDPGFIGLRKNLSDSCRRNSISVFSLTSIPSLYKLLIFLLRVAMMRAPLFVRHLKLRHGRSRPFYLKLTHELLVIFWLLGLEVLSANVSQKTSIVIRKERVIVILI